MKLLEKIFGTYSGREIKKIEPLVDKIEELLGAQIKENFSVLGFTPRTKKILAATPMGRFGQPEDLLGALLFLVDQKAAGFVTGIVIPVDGGFSAYSGV